MAYGTNVDIAGNEDPWVALASAIVIQCVRDYRAACRQLRYRPCCRKTVWRIEECTHWMQSKYCATFTDANMAAVARKLEVEMGTRWLMQTHILADTMVEMIEERNTALATGDLSGTELIKIQAERDALREAIATAGYNGKAYEQMVKDWKEKKEYELKKSAVQGSGSKRVSKKPKTKPVR